MVEAENQFNIHSCDEKIFSDMAQLHIFKICLKIVFSIFIRSTSSFTEDYLRLLQAKVFFSLDFNSKMRIFFQKIQKRQIHLYRGFLKNKIMTQNQLIHRFSGKFCVKNLCLYQYINWLNSITILFSLPKVILNEFISCFMLKHLMMSRNLRV